MEETSAQNPEVVPTTDEVMALLDNLIGTEYTVTELLEDDLGAYIVAVQTLGETEEEVLEYIYRRKGVYEEWESPETEITLNYFVNDELQSTVLVAQLVDGEWVVNDDREEE